MTRRDYDELAEAAERGQMRPVPGTRRSGSDAAADARHAFMSATGASTPEEAARLVLGRPRVNEQRAPAKTWRVRVSGSQNELVERAVEAADTSLSQYVRAAVLEKVERDTNRVA